MSSYGVVVNWDKHYLLTVVGRKVNATVLTLSRDLRGTNGRYLQPCE